MLRLTILQGPDRGRYYDVDRDVVLIGRESRDVPLADKTLSRRHAELHQEEGVWRIHDLNSANGTYVNGVKVAGTQHAEVKVGDQVRCGATLLVIGGVKSPGVMGEPAGSLRIDEDGNIVESAIMTTVPSSDDSIIIAGPETSAAVTNLRLLYELSTAISTIFDRTQLLEKVMDMIFDNFPADRGFVLSRSEEDERLKPRVVRYRKPEDSGEIAISRTIVNHVISNGEGVLCSNAMRDPRFSKGQSVHDYGIHSALCAPITVRGKHLGVIYVDTTVAVHTYSPDQLKLLTAIGYQAGVALEHLRLYHAGVKAERLAAMGETVAYLSHGIKNLLQSLQSAADLVEMGLKGDKIDKARQGWGILQRNLTRVQNLVLNMLAFSKVRKPNLEMTQFNQIVQEAIEMLTMHADDLGVHLIHEIDEHLPAIAIDGDGMQQVLLNLILNAIDAVEPEKGFVTVKTHYDSDTEELLLTVGDNGSGIDADSLAHIFDAFHSQKGQRGTGLGLAVVKKIVEEHKGSVSVASEPNQGTTFTVRVPTSGQPIGDSDGTKGPKLSDTRP